MEHYHERLFRSPRLRVFRKELLLIPAAAQGLDQLDAGDEALTGKLGLVSLRDKGAAIGSTTLQIEQLTNSLHGVYTEPHAKYDDKKRYCD